MAVRVRGTGLWVFTVVVVAAAAPSKEVDGVVKIAPPREADMGDSDSLVSIEGAIGDGVWGRCSVVESGRLSPVVDEGGWRWNSSTVLGGWKPLVS